MKFLIYGGEMKNMFLAMFLEYIITVYRKTFVFYIEMTQVFAFKIIKATWMTI